MLEAQPRQPVPQLSKQTVLAYLLWLLFTHWLEREHVTTFPMVIKIQEEPLQPAPLDNNSLLKLQLVLLAQTPQLVCVLQSWIQQFKA